MIRKTMLSLVLMILMVPTVVNAANTTLNASAVASYMNARVGEAYDNGYCMRFVADCFATLGATRSSACCAYNYGNSHIQSTSMDNIPVGADVFFGNCGGGPCSRCGSTYFGHIGVYVGNGEFVHATGGKVQKSPLSSWSTKYRGWGYHGNVTIVDDMRTDLCTCSTSYAGNYICTSATTLKIRSGHGTSFGEVDSNIRIPSGATVYVSMASGTGENDWGHVTYNGVTGYASMAYLTKTDEYRDLGEEFFAIILHKDSWTPLTYDADEHVRLHTENGTASQVWLFQRQDDGSYTIASAKDGDLLELWEGNTANNTPLVVGIKDWGSDFQRWYIYGNYDTGYIIQSKYKPEIGRVITVQSEEPYDGVEIQTCERSNARTQFFTIYGASEVQMEAPTLSVTTGEGKADFQWTRTYGEAAYDLYIKKDGNAYQTERVQENVTSYTQELPAGTYSACVRAVNAFEQKESNTVSFTIEAVTKDISSSTIELAYTDTVYDGQTKTPKVTVTDGGTPLTEGTEYQVAYSNNQNAGTATVTVTGQGTYTGSVKKSFTIAKAEQALDVRIPKTAIEIDETVQITATTTSGGVIQYRSKDSEIAKVSDAGVITGVSSGQTTISVTAAETGNYLPASKDVTVTVKAVSAADEPTIRIGTVKGTAGQVVSVPISLENNPGIVSMLISVTYDRDVLTLVGVEDAGTFGSTNHNPSYSAFPYRLSWANDTAEKDFDMNGTIVTLKFQISEDAAEGVYPISIVEDDFTGLIFNKALETVPFVPKTGSVDVTKVLLGDVNGDGKVTPVDRACLARYLAGWAGYSADSLVIEAMDVNEDGKITAVDRAVLARHLAGWAGYETLPYRAS